MSEGFLTPTQREAIQSKGDKYTRQMRADIRNRLTGALSDCALLLEYAEERDLQQIAGEQPSKKDVQSKINTLGDDRERLRDKLADNKKHLSRISNSRERRLTDLSQVQSVENRIESTFAGLAIAHEELSEVHERWVDDSNPYTEQWDPESGDIPESTPQQLKRGLSLAAGGDNPVTIGDVAEDFEAWLEWIAENLREDISKLEDESENARARIETRENDLAEVKSQIAELKDDLSGYSLDQQAREDIVATLALLVSMAETSISLDGDEMSSIVSEAFQAGVRREHPERVSSVEFGITQAARDVAAASAHEKLQTSSGDHPTDRLTDIELRALAQASELTPADK